MTVLTGPDLAPPAAGHQGVLVWRAAGPVTALSSAAVGGGLASPAWLLNVGVDDGYARTDLDAHVAEVATSLGLEGEGCALLTAADVAQVQEGSAGGVRVWATVGVTKPTWAVRPARAGATAGAGSPASTGARAAASTEAQTQAVRPGGGSPGAGASGEVAPPPGTINIVVALPAPLTTGALVQAVGTATEAKAQALVEGGVPGTGTASDALVVVCPRPDAQSADHGGPDHTRPETRSAHDGPVHFAGVRSALGAHVATAVHAAVAAGLAAHPWPAPDVDPGVVW